MRYKNLDLNLLVALNTLLQTRNVSATARALNLSQPAMSAALGRLRDYFADDLLVPFQRRMIPTAFAEGLAPTLADVLGGVDQLISTATAFDPALSKRLFRLGASDYVSLVVIAPLLQTLAKIAPGVRLEIAAPSDDIIRGLDRGEIDLLITPEEFLSSGHPSRLLFMEDHILVACERHPIFHEGVSEESFYRYGHVGVELGAQRTPSFGERQMSRLAAHRRVEIIAPSFAVVPWMLPGTMRLAVMHRRLANAVVPVLPLRSVPLPFDFPQMRQMMQFHRARLLDPGVNWLADCMTTAAATSLIDPSLSGTIHHMDRQ